jgi:hypothetical protein
MPEPERAFRDFRAEYGSLDYRDAVVLDIGADYGCTPAFFLERGAKHVIACERNPDWLLLLSEWAEGKPVTVAGMVDSANVGTLLDRYSPDVVKVDCEGCESLLLTLPDQTLSTPRAWVIETHTVPLYEAFVSRMEGMGYKVTTVRDFGSGTGKVCRIITAERDA